MELSRYREWSVAGLVETARFTYASLRQAARWAAGRMIDSRQCLEALRRGILVPEQDAYTNTTGNMNTNMNGNGGGDVDVYTGLEILERDRGGFTMSPEPGLHTDVAELDYESMYPHIIVRMNVSYETLGPNATTGDGLLKAVTEGPLERRLYYKHLKQEQPQGSPERLWCDQRQRALKGILVCIYGYSGCHANRYGSFRCFQEVNRLAREKLLETLEITRSQGYRAVYADTDSVFVKKPGATRACYQELAEEISRRVGLPLALDHHYRYLVFRTRKTDSRLPVAKRHFGVLMDGTIRCRGIELRRHDTPPLVKELQEQLIKTLLEARTENEINRRSLSRALDHVRETCRRLERGEVDWRRLLIRKRLRKPLESYSSSQPHIVAARQLKHRGVEVEAGDTVEYVYVDAGNSKPSRRVAAASLLNQGWRRYDREKYRELVMDAAETVLSWTGWSRNNPSLGKEEQHTQLDIREVIG